MNLKTKQANIKRAVRLAGGVKACADHFGLTKQAIQHWVYKGLVPPKHIIELERMSGVTRHEIDSDIYPESIPCTAPKPPSSVPLRRKTATVSARR